MELINCFALLVNIFDVSITANHGTVEFFTTYSVDKGSSLWPFVEYVHI
jgi:hypothetical protein